MAKKKRPGRAVNCWLSDDVHKALVRRAAKDALKTGELATLSDVLRVAVDEYLENHAEGSDAVRKQD